LLRYRDHGIEVTEGAPLDPLVYAAAQLRIDEAVTGADNRDPLCSDERSVDYVRAKAVGVHDIGTIHATKRSNGTSLAKVIAVTDHHT
jgi:hypothetical protein